MALWGELRRRNVLRVGAAYLVTAWVVAQVSNVVAPALNLPAWVNSLVVWLLLLGLPIALVLAWIFELTPGGVRRERPRPGNGRRKNRPPGEPLPGSAETGETNRLRRVHRMDLAIIAVLVLGLALSVLERQWPRGAGAVSRPGASEAAEPARPAAAPVVLVRPFRNLGDPDADERFTDGLTEELIHALASVPDLAVLARSTSFALRAGDEPNTVLRERFGLDWVVEGTVRRGGDTLRITAQLVDARSGLQRWNRSFDRSGADALATQAEIAREVARELGVRTAGAVADVRASAAAQALYLEARSLERNASVESMQAAHALLHQALEDSPEFVPALLQQVIVVARMPVRELMTRHEARAKVEELLHRLRRIAPGSPETRAAEAIKRAWIDPWSGRPADAARLAQDLEQLSRLLPDHPHWLVNLGVQRIRLGQLDKAEQAFERAARIDPLDQMARSNAGVVAGLRGDVEGYLASDRALLLEGSEFSHLHDAIASAEMSRGRYAEAHRLLADCIEQARLPRCHATLALLLLALERPEQALTALEMGADHSASLRSLLPVALFLLDREGTPTLEALGDRLRNDRVLWDDATYLLGAELLTRGEPQALLSFYREFNPELVEDPATGVTADSGTDLFFVGRAFSLAGDEARARQCHAQALRQFEHFSPLAFPHIGWRVLLLDALGRRDEAVTLLQRLEAAGWSDARTFLFSPSGRPSAIAPGFVADPRVRAILDRMRAHNAAELAAIEASGRPLLPTWASRVPASDAP